MSKSSLPSPEIWFEAAGTRLFVTERGEGLPFVFLHGGLADHRASLFRVGDLASSYRLITPDVRGAGRSREHGDLSWDLLANDVGCLLDHLGLERAAVGGISAGATIALKFARSHPHRALALILVWPAYAGSEIGLVEAQRSALCAMDAAARKAVAVGIEALYPLFRTLPARVRETALGIVGSFDPASVAATCRFLATGAQPFERMSDLTGLSVPTLVVPGLDPEHPAEIAMQYARAIPHCQVADPGAELAQALRDFLDSVSKQPIAVEQG